jgi:type IV pilus assembly protein PilX
MCKKDNSAINTIAINSINTPASAIFYNSLSATRKQRGITLIMVLIFIVTLSLIAAVAMRGVITGERVVANERDRAIAFQGAESAGRVAIQLISTQNTSNFHARPIFPLGGNIEHWRTTNALTANSCRVDLTQISTNRYDWTTDWSAAAPDCSVKTAETYGNKDEPRFVIEYTSKVYIPVTNRNECWYRVTSRASGLTGEADVILQVMYSVEIAGAGVDCKKD